MLRHRLRLFDAVVSPTMNFASGSWKLTKEHERMIQSTQHKMLRLIIQTKRRYKKIGKRKDDTNEHDDTEDLGSTEDGNEDGQSSNTHNDQDSDVSFENDTNDEIDTTAIEEEEWLEYIKRNTAEAIEKIENAKTRCWIKTLKRMKWRLALRIASLPSEMDSESCGKNTSEKQIRLGTTQTRPRLNRKIRVTDSVSREMDIAEVGLMSYGAHFSSCCLPGPLRFVAQNMRIPVISNSVNLFQQQPVFDSLLRVFVFDVSAHCHQQCASALVANSASPISFN